MCGIKAMKTYLLVGRIAMEEERREEVGNGKPRDERVSGWLGF